MCKHAVKRLPFLIRYVSDRYKTQETCDRFIIENCGTLIFAPDSCEICNKAVNTSPATI